MPNISGWRPQRPDARDYRLADHASHLLTAALPAEADNVLQHLDVEDQGPVGSCTAFGSLDAYESTQRKLGLSALKGSKLHQYWWTRYLMGWDTSIDSGAYIRSAVDATVKRGVAEDTFWAYVNPQVNFRVKPPDTTDGSAAAHKSTKYIAIPNDIGQLKAVVAAGYAVVFGFDVYQNFPMVNGIETIPMPAGQVIGGHCVTLVGYSDALQCFRIRNSWGIGWGKRGYAWMPYQLVTNTASDFWFIQEVSGAAPTPPEPEPPLPPEPTPDYAIIDARSLVSNPRGNGAMNASPDTLVHHTVTPISPTASEAEERALITSMDRGHFSLGYGGLAYHMLVFPSSRVYLCGDLTRYRAHIKDRNPEFIGVALVGTFTTTLPAEPQLIALKYALRYLRQAYPEADIFGHKEKAIPSDPTACPGIIAPRDWDAFLEEDPLTDEEKRIIADRNGRVAEAWGSTNEFNYWFDDATRILHAYDPLTKIDVGQIQFKGMPPKLTSEPTPPLESLG